MLCVSDLIMIIGIAVAAAVVLIIIITSIVVIILLKYKKRFDFFLCRLYLPGCVSNFW